jgi:hypothetical protein
MARVAILVTYRDISGRAPEIDQLIAILAKYQLSEVQFLLAKVNCLLGTWQNEPNYDVDTKLTRMFLPAYSYQIEKMRKAANRIVFSRVNLLYLMKLACTACPEVGDNPHTVKGNAQIGIACLMANDLLLPFVPSPSDGTVEKLANVLPFSDYVSHDHYAIEIARSQKMFDDISQLPSLKIRSDFVDVQSLFSSSIGVSHSRFSQLVFGCSTKFLGIKIEDLQAPNAMVVRPSFFQKSTIPVETASQFFGKLAVSLKVLAEKIRSSERPANDFTLLQAFPFLELASGIYTCLDPGFLIEKAGRGLFWTLFSEVSVENKNKLASFWGAIFETYVNSILQENYKAKGTFIAEPRFPNGDQAFDACVLEGSSLIVFEHKSSTLRADCKYSGDVGRLKAELSLKFIDGDDDGAKGLAQLRKSILRFLKGETITDIDLSKVRMIYPVLVCLDSSVTVPYMGTYFNEQFRIGFPRQDFTQIITPVFTLAVSDIENLLPYLHDFRLCDIFDSFYKENRRMLTSLSSSLVPILKDVVPGPNAVKQEFSTFARRMEQELFPAESL